METKTYCATTMAEALAEVKRDLGRDAVILHTRSFRKGGLLGLGGRPMWEITASAQVNVPSSAARADAMWPVGPGAARRSRTASRGRARWARRSPARMAELHGMVSALLTQLDAGCGRSAPGGAPARPWPGASGESGELAAWRAQLLHQDVAESTAAEVLEQVSKELTPRSWPGRWRCASGWWRPLPRGSPRPTRPRPRARAAPRVMVLIGPTGVGKTTTIAKLAAHLRLTEQTQVGLITIDTYRIAAVDQLKTYAQILEVPLQTVLRAGELSRPWGRWPAWTWC